MTLPTIQPTGAMSSGVYTDYMIGYNNAALDELDDDVDNYAAGSVITDWSAKWNRITTDIDATVTTLTSDISKLNAQIMMVKDALKRL